MSQTKGISRRDVISLQGLTLACEGLDAGDGTTKDERMNVVSA